MIVLTVFALLLVAISAVIALVPDNAKELLAGVWKLVYSICAKLVPLYGGEAWKNFEKSPPYAKIVRAVDRAFDKVVM